MIDFFDVGFDTPSTPPAAPREYAVLAEGTHDLEIVAASVGQVAWKASTENPQGECLRLRLSAGRDTAYVFVDVPRERKWLFKAIAASLGLQPGPDGKVSIGTPESLIGRHVRVEVGRYQTRSGETRANVKRWLPATPAAAPAATRPAKAPARTASAKAAQVFRETAAPDDIPF